MSVSTKKRPVAIYILCTLFIILPIFVLLLSRKITNQPNLDLQFTDLFMFFSFFSSALLVLSRYKWAWMISYVLLCAFLLSSSVQLIFKIGTDGYFIALFQFLFSVFSVALLFMVVQYLNSAFFDRRDRLTVLGGVDRFDCQIDCTVEFHGSSNQSQLNGKIVNISMTGGRIELDDSPSTLHFKSIKISIKNIKLLSDIDLVSLENNNILRFEFKNKNPLSIYKQFQMLKPLIKK